MGFRLLILDLRLGVNFQDQIEDRRLKIKNQIRFFDILKGDTKEAIAVFY
jgi:hypothetical protein